MQHLAELDLVLGKQLLELPHLRANAKQRAAGGRGGRRQAAGGGGGGRRAAGGGA